MSFYDWLDEQEKKKKKKNSTQTTNSKSKSFYEWLDENGYESPDGSSFDAPIKQSAKDELRSTLGSSLSNIINRTNSALDPIKPIAKEAEKIQLLQAGALADVDLSGPWYEDAWSIAKQTGKAILGTGADAVVGVTKGGLKVSEGIADAVGYGVAAVGELFGADMDHIKEEASYNTVDEWFADTDEYLDKNSLIGRTGDAVMEGVGQVGVILASGGLGELAGLGTLGTTALTTGTTWLSGFGSGIGEALRSGATDKEAYTYGAISATADAATELIFGGLGKGSKALGISKGLSSADDMLAQAVTKNIKNTLAKNVAQAGIKAGAEGFEELLAGGLQAIGKKMTYMSEEDIGDIVQDENLLEQFIVGAFTSGIAQSPSVSKATKQGRDYVSGLTKNEQSVVDKVYADTVAEKEKNGKLTNKEKNKIYEDVVKQMERGYIDTDTIESVLGGESYENYKSLTEQETAIKDEIEALENTPESQFTVKQRERLTELREQLEGIDTKTAKSNLFSEVDTLTANDTLLRESYNEKARRGQAFEADLTKYDAKQQETIKKAVESGILNNTNRTHEFVDLVAKISADKGVPFDFTNNQKLKESGFAIDGKQVNGYVTKDGVTLNVQSAKSLDTVVGHEITHVIEGTDLYAELQTAIVEYAKSKNDYQGRYDTLAKLYENIEGANIDSELTAELVGDYLFTDTDFIHNLSTNHRNVFQKIYDEIKYLYKVATAGSKEARELERVKKAFDKAYRESRAEITDTKYSVTENHEQEQSIDNGQNLTYNGIRGEAYVRTDEFRNLQAESQRMSDEDTELYHSGSKQIDDEVRGRLSRAFGLELRSANSKRIPSVRTLLNPKTNNNVNIIEGVDGSLFHDVFEISRKYLRNGELVDLHTVETTEDGIGYNDCNNYLSEDGLSGFSITPDGDLISVFNLNTERGFLKTIAPIVKENAKTLDCYASPQQNLMVMYEKIFGFKTASIMDYNMEYDHDNIAENHSMPKVAFMVNTDSDVELREFTKDQYDEAVEYRNSFIDQAADNEAASFMPKNEADDIAPIKHSLSEKGAAPTGKFLGKDIALDTAPVTGTTDTEAVEPDIAPVAEAKVEDYAPGESLEEQLAKADESLEILDSETEALFSDYYAKNISDAEFQAKWKDLDKRFTQARQEQERLSAEMTDINNRKYESLDDSEIPPEAEAPYYGDVEDIAPADPFAERDIVDVGKRNVKAYMYENPEVKPFFQDAAREMLNDLHNGTRGERIFNEQVHYESGGEKGWMGTKRRTTDDIADLLDQWHYTYDQIEAGLNAIIEDNGKENNAASKRIEFMLDNRLRNGYKDVDGRPIPADEGYINLLKEKEIDAYRKESFDSFMEVADQYAPPVEDIAPLKIEPATEGEQTVLDGFEQESETPDALELEKAKLIAEYDNQKAVWKERVANKNTYRTNMAKELYEEIRNIKKGVRASDKLAALLDAGYDWGNLKSAFANVRYTPDHTVNPQSDAEAAVRQMIDESYNDELRHIEELDAELKQKIETLEKEAKNERLTRHTLHFRIIRDIRNKLADKGFDLDEVLDKAHRMNVVSINDNTPQRVNDKTFGYEVGEILNDLTFNRAALRESNGVKWLNKHVDTIRKLSKKYKIKPGSKESAAAQMYAEGFYLDEAKNIIYYGDAELAMDFPDVDVQNRIKALVKDPTIRKIYDDTLSELNESRTRNAYPEIPKLENYYLHFRAMDDTFSRLGIPFNPNDIRAKDLPTDINGTTIDRKPGKSFFASELHRKGKRTSFDMLGGLETYLNGAKNQIFHIDDIQTTRALWGYIADRYGQALGLEYLDSMELEAQQERIQQVFDGHLSTYARFLLEYGNNLAGKTALIDRGVEGLIGRRALQFINTVNTQTGRNQIGYSISSPLTNFIPSMEAIARTSKQDSIKAFAQTVSNVFRKDGFVESDPTLIRRKGADRFSKTLWEKMSDPGYILMGAVDNVTSEFIVRTKYNELTRKGMDSKQAHIRAGEWASRVMGDRSLGQTPLLYNSKFMGLFTKYQLEVRNALDSQFYDTFQEAKASTKDIENQKAKNAVTAAKFAYKAAQIAVLNHVFGMAFEKIAGYNPAFDIISTIATLFGWDDEEDDEDTFVDNLKQARDELLGDLPYVSIFTGGGRIPVSGALPIQEALTGKDQYGNEKALWQTLAEALPYYILPGGYNQIKKTTQGLGMFSDEHPVTGSYTDSGNLRFPVEKTFGNVLQAGLFGQYASENARDYFDNERSPLKEKQIQEYIDVDMPIQDYWEYREGLAKLDTNEEKVDYIDSLDLPLSKKNILVNNVLDRKEPVDMAEYSEYGSLEEFDFAVKYPEKYQFLEENGITVEQYNNFDTDTKEAYSWAYQNPDKYAVSKAVSSDLVEYKSYTKDIYEIEADKDENGKSISGSKKEKVYAYIDSLPLDYGQKSILFKSQYKSDDSMNMDIIEYLDSREDISYEEMVTILTELGFTVNGNNVYWD